MLHVDVLIREGSSKSMSATSASRNCSTARLWQSLATASNHATIRLWLRQ